MKNIPEDSGFFMRDHNHWMRKVLSLAEKGRGFTSPNPVVGAVIVKDGKVAGEGYHKKFGDQHAEVIAISKAGENVKGAALYVNLEPCCIQSKTPPCTEAIIKSGIKEIYIGTIDPNPKVSGEGIRILRRAGLNVVVGILESEAKSINRGFIKYVTEGTPWVTLKLGITADGYIGDVSGKSKWITSEEARKFVKKQRNLHDAVMVGMGTIFKDDPSLLPEYKERRIPCRVVLDETLNIPFRFNVVSDEYRDRTIILTIQQDKEEKAKQLEKSGVKVLKVKDDSWGWINLPDAFKSLAELGITSVYCEGGGFVAGSIVKQRLADELQMFVSPKILGEGISSFSGFMKSLDEAIELKWKDHRMVGSDILLIGTIA